MTLKEMIFQLLVEKERDIKFTRMYGVEFNGSKQDTIQIIMFDRKKSLVVEMHLLIAQLEPNKDSIDEHMEAMVRDMSKVLDDTPAKVESKIVGMNGQKIIIDKP